MTRKFDTGADLSRPRGRVSALWTCRRWSSHCRSSCGPRSRRSILSVPETPLVTPAAPVAAAAAETDPGTAADPAQTGAAGTTQVTGAGSVGTAAEAMPEQTTEEEPGKAADAGQKASESAPEEVRAETPVQKTAEAAPAQSEVSSEAAAETTESPGPVAESEGTGAGGPDAALLLHQALEDEEDPGLVMTAPARDEQQ